MEIKFTGENFEHHWGFIDWKNKTILDIGADYGSTAECFLASGAKMVYASEGDAELYKKLIEYTKNKPNVIPSSKMILCSNDFVQMFNDFINCKIDICKMDCESAEIHLLNVPDDLIRSIKEYAIECHSPDILNKMLEKFKNIGFEVVQTKFIGVNLGLAVFVMHAVLR